MALITTGGNVMRSVGIESRYRPQLTERPASSRVLEGELLSSRPERSATTHQPRRHMRFATMPTVRLPVSAHAAATAYGANVTVLQPRHRLDVSV